MGFTLTGEASRTHLPSPFEYVTTAGGPETDHFWSSFEIGETNEGSPYLYEQDDEISHRPDDEPNPAQWPSDRGFNDDLIDMPPAIEDPTSLEWMD